MAEELTIDTSKLTKTAIKFRAGMTALLDTEYEYIQYQGTGVVLWVLVLVLWAIETFYN